MAKEISRRNFLKGTAAGAVGMAVASLAGAEAFAENTTSAAATTAETVSLPTGFIPTGEDFTYGAFLNPQDASGFADSGNLSHLFSPLKIGGVTLKNRIMNGRYVFPRRDGGA